MKRAIPILLLLLLMFSTPGCLLSSNQASTSKIQSYRDIPGVTSEEVSAIEGLKSSHEYFTYGQMFETEAFISPDGSYRGFTVEFCKLLSELFGIEFRLEIYDWETLKSGIDSKQIDFTGDLTPTIDRLQRYYMTHPIAERTLRAFSYSGGQEILTESDINGLTVGFLEGAVDLGQIHHYYPELVFRAVEVESFESAAEQLKSGEIDVFITEGVVDPLFDEYGYIDSRELFPLVYTPVSLTTANTELEPIINVVNKYISAGGIDTLSDLYKVSDREYARYKLSHSLSDTERSYLASLSESQGTVKIALEPDNYPICFYNAREKAFQGIAVDTLAELSDLTGIEFEVVNDEKASWLELLDMLEKGDVSLISHLLYSDERSDQFLWTEKPYAAAQFVLISREEYPNLASFQVVQAKVGVLKNSAYEDKYREWFPNNDNVVEFDYQDVMLDALESGDIDLVIGSDYLLLIQQNYRERPGFKTNIRLGAVMYSNFGLNRDERTLCSILDKAQHYVNTNAIEDDWNNRGYDYNKTMSQQRTVFALVIVGVLALALILVFYFLLKNRRLNKGLEKTVQEITLDIRTALAKQRAIISNYSGVIFSVDRENTITLFDGQFLKNIEVTSEFLEGKNVSLAAEKNRHLDVIENIERTYVEGPQSWISNVDGKMFRLHTTPIYTEDGEATGVVGNAEDLTEILSLQKDLETSLEDNEFQLTQLKLVVQAARVGLWDMTSVSGIRKIKETNEVIWSDQLRHLLGFSSEEDFPNLLDSLSSRLHPEDFERMLDSFSKHVFDKTGKTPFDVECRLLKRDNVYAYYRAYGETIRDEEGNALRVAGALRDITEEKEFELEKERQSIAQLEQMDKQRASAEAANQAKSAFLSAMSHEIRTPMNAIMGITDIQLQNDKLDQGTKESFEKIYDSGDLLMGIINDILDLSKIEAGKLELIPTDYEIASLINDTVQLNIMRIGSKPIEFMLSLDEHLPFTLRGDELRIRQILNNLLSNAFKYTAEGSVTLSISQEAIHDTEDADVRLVFEVRDTGQGMTKEQIDKLFDEYAQFNLEANRTTEGTGLGMSITRNLLNLMGGGITVASNPGRGSVFTASIPQKRVGSAVLGRELAENLQQLREGSRAQMKRVQITREPMPYGSVLIVDDVATNIYVAMGLMAPYGLKMDSADSGFKAIEKVKEGKVYDIIFMDHMMPKMDGIEATKRIRKMGYDHPIVALTANAVVGQADVFRENGFDEFISKPIDIRQLNVVLNTFIRDKQPPEVIKAARAKATIPGKEKKKGHKEPTEAELMKNNPRLAEFFIKDATTSLEVLEAIQDKQGAYDEEDDLRAYIINTHGMKSALANIGKQELSEVASRLEQAGQEGDTKLMSSETPEFIRSLRELVEKLAALR